MSSIQPIETRFKGYRFRSRLEARWAVFFDALGVAWEYEPQGFVLPNRSTYLPDFWLPDIQMWAEVKAVHPTKLELNKAKLLTESSRFETLFLIGIPGFCSYWAITGNDYCPYCDYILDTSYLHENRFFSSTGIDHRDDSSPEPVLPTPLEDGWADDSFRRAVMAARSARFEHGERS